MLFIKNRYDNLMGKAKKLRNKIEKKNTKTAQKTAALQTKINKLNYQKTVYCSDKKNQLIDVESLLTNERKRIIKDYQDTKLGDLM